MREKKILLIVSGGIAAYKALELTRRLQDRGAHVRGVLTRAAQEFVTPLSLAALTGERVHTELFELTAEVEMGHIELSRSAELLLVAPATADLMAKMATGQADDLASTLLLATDTPIMAAPAMNVRMWEHPATRRNLQTLAGDGVRFVGPNEGAMACGEFGFGRMAEPAEIVAAVEAFFGPRPLAGRRAVITSGPTHEPIDPVRYIANRSSGKQGAAIATALAKLGAEVAYVTGPTAIPAPAGCREIRIETARQMRDAVMAALPADIAIFAAAVADGRPATAADAKMKKTPKGAPPALALTENPDILAEVSALDPARRPGLVIGFAAETNDVLDNARAKRKRKGCDWLVANDVGQASGVPGGVMGGDSNEVVILDEAGEERWPQLSKEAVGQRLAERIARHLGAGTGA